MPDPERWKRIADITADALERVGPERAAWLDQACDGDADLRREVESLLAADARSGAFLERAAIASDGAAAAVHAAARESLGLVAGRRIGPYRIVKELGHGGMGVVYLAARADHAFEKDVAIKVVRGGFDRDAVSRRFGEERRILASLDHPNIARLLDAGVTGEGLSYFVMEYVDGIALDAYCETGRLSLPERLRLFLDICSAIEYAHQRLVVHRDIKPRNILVTAGGTPKLLDFGIAKLLDQDGGDGLTRTGLRAFTLEYASPEQVRGEPIAVTSDVYALGVLLYQLITGHRPYGAADRAESDLVRAICSEPPISPVVAAREGTRFRVDIELEWVLLKALRKEPDRRYQSVGQLADDVRRFLGAQPVLAGPDSRRYRARKFVSRHRGAVAAVALVTLSLVSGMTATLWQARRADEQRARAELRFQNARRLANAMVFELNDAIEAGGTSARALLLTRASEQLDALARDAPGDPVLTEELATAYHRLGDVQGSADTPNLGDQAAALINHRKGLVLRRAMANRAPQDVEAKLRLGESLMAVAAAENDVGPSLELARAAVTDAISLFELRPQEIRVRRHLAMAHYTLGVQQRTAGEIQLALGSLERATRFFQEVYDANRGDADVRRLLALCHKRLGALLADSDAAKAIPHMRRAVELDEASRAANPAAPQRRRDLSSSNIQLGFALRQTGDAQGALAAYRQALTLREGLMRDDPTNVLARHDVASALFYIGQLENDRLRRYVDAQASLERALPMAAPLTNVDQLSALILTEIGDSFEYRGLMSDALSWRIRATEQFRALFKSQPKSKALHRALVAGEVQLGATLMHFATTTQEPALRARRRQEACIAYRDASRALALLGEAEAELSPDISENYRKGIEICGTSSGNGR
jgi:eukaryotic-like serine/threonine-protein kinase